MCLLVDKKSVERGANLRNKTGKRVYWKVVINRYDGINSSVKSCFEWKPGWNISDRPLISLNIMEGRNQIVERGIHVFTSRKQARKSVWFFGHRVVKVICYNKDCVAFDEGGTEAVYTKVFLARDEYKSALTRKTIERR